MTPSVPDRIDSAIRALTFVVLPSLPQRASLAREQTQLVIAHLQIMLAQYDATPDFEKGEAGDFADLARACGDAAQGGPATTGARDALRKRLGDVAGLSPLARTKAVQEALDDLLLAIAEDGEPAANGIIRNLVLDRGHLRANADRRWFALTGFDPLIAEETQAASA